MRVLVGDDELFGRNAGSIGGQGNPDGVEECLEAIVVPGGNGIVLVIVAAGAAEGQPQEDGPGRGGDFIQEVLPQLFGGQVAEIPGGQPQETGGNVSLNFRFVPGLAAVLVSPPPVEA